MRANTGYDDDDCRQAPVPMDMCRAKRVSSADERIAIAAVERELITLDRLATVIPVHRKRYSGNPLTTCVCVTE
jgi:hypothetical protein